LSRWGIIDSTLEGRQLAYFPHYMTGKVPLEPEANRLFRSKMRGLTSARDRALVKKMCREDLLFYTATFVYIFQAKGDPKPVPFLLHDFQVECVTLLWKCLHDKRAIPGHPWWGFSGQTDCRGLKPRDMGFTWFVIVLFEHGWHFMPMLQFCLGSRNADEVDGSTRDSDKGGGLGGQWSKLLPKVDFIHLNQPSWLWPEGYVPRTQPVRTFMRIVNPELGGLIEGASASPKFARGGRYYGIGFDEHAHTDHGYEIIGSSSQSSDCHIWWSSPNGPSTAHAMLGRSPIPQIRLEWWMNPAHTEGMTVDPDKGDRGRWSPWLEKEMARVGYDPVHINNEIWADESQATGAYYAKELFDIMLGVGTKEGTVRDPAYVGELDYRTGPTGPWVTGFIPQASGRWKFWLRWDAAGRPVREDRYILCVDVAAGGVDAEGRGASNSAIVVVSELQCAKVAEYATHGMPVPRFAELFVAASRFFCGTDEHGWLNWDAGGCGNEFGRLLTEEYGLHDNVYHRSNRDGTVRAGYLKAGSRDELRRPWGLHETMLWEGRYLERSVDTVNEMRHYNHNPTGGPPFHSSGKGVVDPSGARENHGDRTMATVLACMELSNRRNRPQRDAEIPPFGSYAHLKLLESKRARDKLLI